MSISNKVIESLIKSGWYSSRNIDISSYEEAYENGAVYVAFDDYLDKLGGKYL